MMMMDMKWQGGKPMNETPFGKYNDLLGGRPNGRPTGQRDARPRLTPEMYGQLRQQLGGMTRMPMTAQAPRMAAPGAPGQSPMSAPRQMGGFGLMRRFI